MSHDRTRPDSPTNPVQEESAPQLAPCSCGNEAIEILWCDDTEEPTEGELLVFAHCGNCGATGPEAVTNSDRRNPLTAAERAATTLWNQHRTATLEMAMKLPEIQLMFRLLDDFKSRGGKPEEQRQDVEELKICNEELVLHRRFFDKLRAWTHEFGAELCPPSSCADTYGEGVRETKDAVKRMLNELEK